MELDRTKWWTEGDELCLQLREVDSIPPTPVRISIDAVIKRFGKTKPGQNVVALAFRHANEIETAVVEKAAHGLRAIDGSIVIRKL